MTRLATKFAPAVVIIVVVLCLCAPCTRLMFKISDRHSQRSNVIKKGSILNNCSGRNSRHYTFNNCTVTVRKKYLYRPHPQYPYGRNGFPVPPLNRRKLSERQKQLIESIAIDRSRTFKIQRLYGFERKRAWLDYINSLNDEGLAPLTKFAQKVIFDHQNPDLSTCKNSKYLVIKHQPPAGLGYLVHAIGSALGHAIEHNRILLWDTRTSTKPTGWPFFDAGCGGNGHFDTLDCIFEPLTSCGYEHSNSQNTVYTFGDEHRVDNIEPWNPYHAPSMFTQALLQHTSVPLTSTAIKYWWRGQATAYILRLNEMSLTKLRALRLDTHLNVGFTINKSTNTLETKELPFPLPTRSFSIHVRHGDKFTEMRLVPFLEYVEEAEWFAKQNPNSYHKSAFISSEDPTIFEEAKNISSTTFDFGLTSPNENWIWYMSKIKRINTGPLQQLDTFGNRTATTLSWLLQLFMALECDAHVGTLSSNWNRIIDELRCIWVDKCFHPYLEVGDVLDWANYQY